MQGQGCSSGLQDANLLCQTIEAADYNLDAALPQYNRVRCAAAALVPLLC